MSAPGSDTEQQSLGMASSAAKELPPATNLEEEGSAASMKLWRAILSECLEEQQHRICESIELLLAAQTTKMERNLLERSVPTAVAAGVHSSEASSRRTGTAGSTLLDLARAIPKRSPHPTEVGDASSVDNVIAEPVERRTRRLRKGAEASTNARSGTMGPLRSGTPSIADSAVRDVTLSSPAATPCNNRQNSNKSIVSGMLTNNSLVSWRQFARKHITRDDMQHGGHYGYTSMSSRVSRKPRYFPQNSRVRQQLDRMEALQAIQRREGQSEFPTESRSNWQDTDSTWRLWLRSCMRDVRFEVLIFFLILANVVMVGIEVEYTSQRGMDFSGVFLALDACFTAIFLFEVSIRALSEGMDFVGEHQIWWNLFDCLVVFVSVVEVAVSLSLQGQAGQLNVEYMRFMRVVRVARVLRAVRLVRLVRFIRALRTLVDSIFFTLKSLIWAILLLVMILYGFGLAITQIIARYIRDNDMVEGALLEYWDSLPTAMLTLFKSITGGVSWHEAVQPLDAVSPFIVALFVLYITFATFAVLNVLTAVFCQSAIDSAAQDKETLAFRLMVAHDRSTAMMREVFEEIDKDDSGTITAQEFEHFLSRGEVRAYFASLDIDIEDAWMLFHLLDKDGQQQLELQQFLDGCLSLKGNARAVQIAQLQQDHRGLVKLLQCFIEDVFEQLDDMQRQFRRAPGEREPGHIQAVTSLERRAPGRALSFESDALNVKPPELGSGTFSFSI